MNQLVLQLLVNLFKYLLECWQLVCLVLCDFFLAPNHERHVLEESVVLEEVSEVGEVASAPPGVLEGCQAEEVTKPSHFNNIYYYNNHYLARFLTKLPVTILPTGGEFPDI
jgi:hypothetical protein